MSEMAVKHMVSMELDDEDQLDAVMPIPMNDKPKFPYGLIISLCEKQLEKLRLELPSADDIGGMIHGHFMARVTHVSNDEDGRCRLEAQIEDLEIESEDEENKEADRG